MILTGTLYIILGGKSSICYRCCQCRLLTLSVKHHLHLAHSRAHAGPSWVRFGAAVCYGGAPRSDGAGAVLAPPQVCFAWMEVLLHDAGWRPLLMSVRDSGSNLQIRHTAIMDDGFQYFCSTCTFLLPECLPVYLLMLHPYLCRCAMCAGHPRAASCWGR